jgi:hypothetical protein
MTTPDLVEAVARWLCDSRCPGRCKEWSPRPCDFDGARALLAIVAEHGGLSAEDPRATSLATALRQTLNAHSAENGSDTPDFILADLLFDVLSAYNTAVRARERWYGRERVGEGVGSAPPPPTQPGAASTVAEEAQHVLDMQDGYLVQAAWKTLARNLAMAVLRAEQPATAEGTEDREALGRTAREVIGVDQFFGAVGSWTWDELVEADKEGYRRISETLYRMGRDSERAATRAAETRATAAEADAAGLRGRIERAVNVRDLPTTRLSRQLDGEYDDGWRDALVKVRAILTGAGSGT